MHGIRSLIFNLACVLAVLPLVACDGVDSDIRGLQKQVNERVNSDLASLATFETIFYITYKHYRSTFAGLVENFYIREEEATVPYGYDLSEIKVLVTSQDGTRYLQVSIPSQPKQMPIDRRMIRAPIMSEDDIIIKDEKGNEVDVDAELNKMLQGMISKYSDQLKSDAARLTNQYFTNLAARLGLELSIQYTE